MTARILGSRGRSPSMARARPPVRLGLRALGVLAPGVAARAAEAIFCRPPARRVRPDEEAWSAGAARFSFEAADSDVDGLSWGRSGPWVLLVHGWGGRAAQMGLLGRSLAARGYRAAAWDLPGHGPRTRPTDLLEMAASVAALADRIGPPAGVVAHSFGTAVTFAAVALHGLPVPRLTAIAPVAHHALVHRRFADYTGFPTAVVDRMRENLARRLEFSWDDVERDTVAPGIRGPALVVHDESDVTSPWEAGRALARALPRAGMVTTRGLGHSGPLRDPSVAERVGDFFPDLTPRRPAVRERAEAPPRALVLSGPGEA